MYELCHFLRSFIEIPPDPLIRQAKKPIRIRAIAFSFFNKGEGYIPFEWLLLQLQQMR